jgi:hypothetical protein
VAHIETALVSSTGRLLLELDDGTIIDAGAVRGSQGPQGLQGNEGPRGADGRNGADGANGAMWHTGVGMPELALGDSGDLYMDVANSLLPIYQKVGNDWLLLCNLKVPPSGGGGGSGGGAAGGGGSIIIYPKPDGGAPPSTDNDGKPIDKGDIWLDTNTGFLWVYNGTNWLPVGDRPPVSISPTPPLWNPAGDTNNRYPIVEGDLWFDSDQLALYVAAKDEDDDFRWVITTPADRSVLQDEVDIPDAPFLFPSPKVGGGSPFDEMTVYNPVTNLWYVFNASKNQWIDLPPGVNELSMRAILVRGADNFDETFEFEQADRDRLGTDALCYVNADDHDAFSRIVIPGVDTANFDWTFLLRALQAGDQLTLIQKDETDPDDPSPFRSDYLTVGEITENSESFNTEISFESEQPVHAPLFDEPVLIRFKAIVNNPEPLDDYVLKSGDTMTGPLVMDNSSILIEHGDINFTRIGTDVELSDIDNRFSLLKSIGPVKADTGEFDYSERFGIKVDIDGGNSYRNNFTVGNRHGDIVKITGGSGAQIELPTSGFSPNYANTGLTSGVPIRHIPTPSFEDSPGDLAVNKQYVDTRDELLRQDIIELEEEINAIAPSLEYGTWKYEEPTGGNVTRPPLTGTFYLMNGAALTDQYLETTIIKIHNNEYVAPGDTDPADNHTWADADVGELIQLFDSADPDFFLGKITAKTVDPVGEFVALTVDRIQSSGAPNDNADPITGEFLTRINIFKEPSGGNASEFVMKIGDEMSGNLSINTSEGSTNVVASLALKGTRPSTTNSAATIAFENDQSTNLGYLTYRSYSSDSWFGFNRDIDLNNNKLHNVAEIRMQTGGYIGISTAKRLILRSGGSNDGNNAATEIQRPGDNKRTFAIKGKAVGSSSTTDFFWAYGNSGSGGDAINYTGLTTQDNHIATKKYVDSVAPTYKITKSGGNYYVS